MYVVVQHRLQADIAPFPLSCVCVCVCVWLESSFILRVARRQRTATEISKFFQSHLFGYIFYFIFFLFEFCPSYPLTLFRLYLRAREGPTKCVHLWTRCTSWVTTIFSKSSFHTALWALANLFAQFLPNFVSSFFFCCSLSLPPFIRLYVLSQSSSANTHARTHTRAFAPGELSYLFASLSLLMHLPPD